MIAARATVDEVRAEIGATSLGYLSLEGLQAATRRPENALCRACLTRDYPTEIPVPLGEASLRDARLERVRSPVPHRAVHLTRVESLLEQPLA